MPTLIEFDKKNIGNYGSLIGVDEVGRGPLAGPVVVCAVKIDENFFRNAENFPFLKTVNDSKKLTAKRREQIFREMEILRQKELIQLSFAEKSPTDIDLLNILEANTQAMFQAIESISDGSEKIIIDGNFVKNLAIKHENIIKGDGKSLSIAMASIAAKVFRDRLMCDFHKEFPVYNFAKNKGYGTSEHIAAIRQYGLSSLHRRSFCKNFTANN